MIELNPPDQAARCCILLHGLGASGEDLQPLAGQLWTAPAVRWLLPHAPQRPITVNGGYEMRAWYDVQQPDLLAAEDADGIKASHKQLCQLIDDQVASGIPRHSIVLAGFSQGGAMALYSGLRQPEPLAAIVAMSAYLPLAASLGEDGTDPQYSTPVFLGAGEHDSLIPPGHTFAAGQQLERAGCRTEARAYPMEHSICPEEVGDIARFLQREAGPQTA